MNSIVSIGAITKIPDNATRQEWKSASEKYKQMSAQIDKIFGENTSVLIDQYFSMKGDATDWNEQQAAYKFLDIHPQIQQALDWQAKTILSDPIMSKYYASINTIESYVKSTMNSALVKKYGQNLIDMVAVYNDMKRNGLDDEAKALAKANPEIWNYFDDYYDVWLPLVDSKILELANNLKPGTMTQLMENVSYDTMQQGMQEATKEQKQYYQFTWKEWQDQMSPALARIAEDFIVDGEDINDTSQRALERLADKYGISYYELLAALQYAYPSSYQNR
jgi:hypothetical protein